MGFWALRAWRYAWYRRLTWALAQPVDAASSRWKPAGLACSEDGARPAKAAFQGAPVVRDARRPEDALCYIGQVIADLEGC
ncbi:hypothetical protein Ato02nite_016120 [Paractinoplanes toevensis]|uniref:Uncharacterized protein n=1 Tax=Paractinoplanes toevensis TaxID=571911 RepID=A0A919T8U0_9ACTN|nr:hypothetical protein Ato02nite_016120 [Actinoplanes toevensis]